METLRILNFIQLRHVLELLFSSSDYQPLFHSFEKLELYKTFVSQLGKADETQSHVSNIADMQQRLEEEERDLHRFIEADSNRHPDRLTRGNIELRDLQQITESFRSVIATNMERQRDFNKKTLHLFEIPILGKDSNSFESNHVVSFAKSLQAYRIFSEPIHDRLFDLAMTRVPAEPLEKEKYLNFLLYCAAKHPSGRNYRKMQTLMSEHDMVNRITNK